MKNSIHNFLLDGEVALKEAEVSRPRREAEELLSHALRMKRMDLYLEFEKPLNPDEIESYNALLQRRASREPLAYILGEIEFYNCKFQVNPNVLIPRVETELLVDHVVKTLSNENKTLWDLCAGSGCIGISLKKQYPQLQITLTDQSPHALHVAKENAQNNQVEVTLLQGDLFQPLAGKKADIIICNPPYISNKEYNDLEPEVKNHEPKLALVAEDDGLQFYQRLADELPSHLNPGGKVWLECGHQQIEALKKIFNQQYWKQKTIIPDFAGINRFFFLEIE